MVGIFLHPLTILSWLYAAGELRVGRADKFREYTSPAYSAPEPGRYWLVNVRRNLSLTLHCI